MKSIRWLVALCALVLLAPLAPAHAQTVQAITVASCGSPPNTPVAGNPYFITQDATGKLCVNATVSATATFTGFTPTGNATLATSSTTARVALPSADTTALLRNTGTVDEWINFGNGAVTATTSNTLLPAGQAIAFTIPAGATNVAAITSSAAGTLAVSTGTGTPVMTGGGGGTGGGGAITAAASSYAASAFSAGAGVDGWDLTEGAKADAAWTTGSGSVVAVLKAIAGNTSGPIPAGSGIIGKVGIDQTTDGTTNAVHLVAGTAIAGKVGIDQTTDGTTNAVHLVAGTALAGKVGIDQTTPGTTNGVQDAATSATGSAVPAKASYVGAQSGGNVTGIIQANASAFLNMTTATTTKIITGVSAKKVYITSFRLHAGGTTTAKFVEGTGTNCGTGTADLSETFDFTASDGSNQGNGLGPTLVAATAADDICVTSSAAVNLRVGAAYEIH